MASSGFTARELMVADESTFGIQSAAAGTYYFQKQQISNHETCGFQVQVQGASAAFSATVSYEVRACAKFNISDSSAVMISRNAAWCPFQVSGSTYTQTITPAAAVLEATGKLAFKSVATGTVGNEVVVTTIAGGTAGAEIVTVATDAATGITTITVKIETTVSTAAQIKTALDGSTEAAALIATTVTASGAVTAGLTSQLVGGCSFLDMETAASQVRIKVVVSAGTAAQVRAFFVAKT